MSLFVHISTIIVVAKGLRTRRQDAGSFQPSQDGIVGDAYSFDNFARDFGRTYLPGGEEYLHRAAIFQESLSQIHAKNSRTDRSWTAGVYPFMDWTGAERAQRLHGYEPTASRRPIEQRPLTAMQTSSGAAHAERVYGGADDGFEADTPPVRDQGGLCGSCWAFSAAAAVEAQLRKSGSPWSWENGEPHLSVQALLDCVPNPSHCGGKGGCFGATPELAFDFMRDTGVPTEENLPYHPLHSGKCPVQTYPQKWERITLAGWRALPSNQAQPLMQALVQDGPVVVAADAHKDWYHYESGIFDGCSKDAILNHGLLAKGYGAEGGKKYWRLQNSWGTKWGEQGTIRLVRHDDEDSWCGTDSRPEEGFACEGEEHRNVTVCGTCGLLFDMTIPRVGRVMAGQDVSSASSSATPVSNKPDAAAGLDLLRTYSAGEASSVTASSISDAKSPSESSVAMPRLNEQGLVDLHDGGLEISDVAAAFQLPQLQPMTAAQHFTVEPAVDSMTDLVDVLPIEDLKPQTETLPAHYTYVAPLPTMADALRAGMDWPSSRATQKGVAAQPEALGESWFAWTARGDLSKRAAVFDLHSKDSRPQGDMSSTSLADHGSSLPDPSLSGWRSEAKMPFRSLKATDSMDAYVRLTD